ncbi:MAG: hypothetical protein H6Q67_1238 [Firmicutes bacterium]|nr:hypothetical protein [Bacillota bacterium]
MKKLWYVLLCAFLIMSCLLTGCRLFESQSEVSSSKVSIVDASGATVEIPANIMRIADGWPAHNEILCMLGAGDKIVATVGVVTQRPWMNKINPQMNKAVAAFNMSDANLEALMKEKPDIVFMTLNNKSAKKIADLGIPVVQLTFNDFSSMKECIRTTGRILGEEGRQRAEKYIGYLDSKLMLISGRTVNIPQEQKPKVLHISSLHPLVVSGKGTFINAWIETAGGINAADISTNMQEVSMERIVQWNPDIIIVGNTALPASDTKDEGRDLGVILNNEEWQQINAVKNSKVYLNPDGSFLWDRYGAEAALQIQWAAKTFYPDKFADIDMLGETMYFYKTFLNYDLSEKEAKRILSAMPPEDVQ